MSEDAPGEMKDKRLGFWVLLDKSSAISVEAQLFSFCNLFDLNSSINIFADIWGQELSDP